MNFSFHLIKFVIDQSIYYFRPKIAYICTDSRLLKNKK